jgi:hypothetical protein
MMIDKPKRKTSELRLTYHDKSWLCVLYRWAKVSKVRHFHVPLSPEICLTCLQPTEETRNLPSDEVYIRKREIAPLDDGSGYEFQAEIRRGWRGYDQPDVNGLIADDGYGQSLVTIRTYPGNMTSIGVISMLACCYGAWHSPERIAICGLLFMLVVFAVMALAEQDASLDHIASVLTKTQPAPSDPTLPPPVKIRHHKNMQRKL